MEINKLLIAPVLREGENVATRIAIIFNRKELPAVDKVVINNQKFGVTTVTVVWTIKETDIEKIELKSFIREEDIENL